MCRTSLRMLSIICLAFCCSTLRAADEPAEVFTDPTQAGPDYAVQGEYAGEVKGDNESVKIGVQVIANHYKEEAALRVARHLEKQGVASAPAA